MDQIMIGNLGLSALLTLVVGIIYQFFTKPDGNSAISDFWKTRIVILAGAGLGLLGLLYHGTPFTTITITNAVIDGLQTGLASIGMWKGLGTINNLGNAISANVTALTSSKPQITLNDFMKGLKP